MWRLWNNQFDSVAPSAITGDHCYVVLHLEQTVPLIKPVPNLSQSKFKLLFHISSLIHPTDLSAPLSTQTFPLSVYVWCGKRASALDKALAVAKGWQLQRAVDRNQHAIVSMLTEDMEPTTLDRHAAPTTHDRSNLVRFSHALLSTLHSSPLFRSSFGYTSCGRLERKPTQLKLKTPRTRKEHFPIPHPSQRSRRGMVDEDGRRRKIRFFATDCTQITDFLFVGGIKVATDAELLREKGITHVVNCAGDSCENVFEGQLTYLRLYLEDKPNEDITCVAYDVFDFIEAVRERGGKTLVHCHQGVSRSTTLCIAYLMLLRKLSYEDAYQLVRDVRRICRPNMGFKMELLAWEQGWNTPRNCLFRVESQSLADLTRLVCKKLSCKGMSLDPRTVYVLQTPATIFVWVGSLVPCAHTFLTAANLHVGRLQHFEGAPPHVVRLYQDSPIQLECEYDDAVVGGAEFEAQFWEALTALGLERQSIKVTSNRLLELKTDDMHEVLGKLELIAGVLQPSSDSPRDNDSKQPDGI